MMTTLATHTHTQKIPATLLGCKRPDSGLFTFHGEQTAWSQADGVRGGGGGLLSRGCVVVCASRTSVLGDKLSTPHPIPFLHHPPTPLSERSSLLMLLLLLLLPPVNMTSPF